MRFDWDPHKESANQRKHGVGFEEATTLFTSGVRQPLARSSRFTATWRSHHE
jgi:uncharacterized DUF497 family protein